MKIHGLCICMEIGPHSEYWIDFIDKGSVNMCSIIIDPALLVKPTGEHVKVPIERVPVIPNPFSKIIMDIADLLSQSNKGNEYNLIV